MRKILIAAATVMLTAGASLFGASAADKLKVGFIYLGPIGDLGWTYQHELARQALVKEFGDKIETTYLENVPEGPDAERAIEQLVRAGNKLIFTTSFGYMDPTLKVAKKYPNVHFEHATGYKRDANMSTYSARWYQGRYIQGIIAAKMSKAGVLGYIGSFPIPEVVSGINATMLGAQTVNPNIKVKVIWVNTWFGQDSEMIKFGPKAQLTSILDTWAPYYIARVKAELDGSWKSEDTWGGLDSKMFAMAPYTNMPDDVKKMAEDTQAAITAGKLFPFKCPIVGQDGKEVECKGGDHLADGQVLGMNFYVKGVDDKIPGK
jgi:simple sugar transport system substrate-binding protein